MLFKIQVYVHTAWQAAILVAIGPDLHQQHPSDLKRAISVKTLTNRHPEWYSSSPVPDSTAIFRFSNKKKLSEIKGDPMFLEGSSSHTLHLQYIIIAATTRVLSADSAK